MSSLNQFLDLIGNGEIEAKVDEIIKEKQDAVDSCCKIYVSIFSPIGAIYMILGSIYSNFLIFMVGVFLLFWGTISYSILVLRNRLKKIRINKILDDFL